MTPYVNVISVLLAFLYIVTLAEANLRLWRDIFSPENLVIGYFFPKNPILQRVRNTNQTEGLYNGAILDFVGLVEKHGYPAEEHYVTTEDGYDLTLHRIPDSPRRQVKGKKRVVFVQHGILSSSDTWVLFGPDRDLPFLLADEGYDVWLGNIRGNSYCRTHEKLNATDEKFWEYSYHEMGIYDLPAMLDYVLNNTNQKSLHYIGHSMGTTMLFTLLSVRPEYNAKIKLGLCLAPVAFWIELTPTLGLVANNAPLLKAFFDKFDIHDIGSLSSSGIVMRKILCRDEVVTQILCITVLFAFSGSDPGQLNTTYITLQTELTEMLSYYPAGASVRTLLHFYQNIITKEFESFNYGFQENYQRYKQGMPIRYNIDKITAPIALFYGLNDKIATKTNVLHLQKRLPNVILLEENDNKLWSHTDFIWALNAKSLIYDRLLEVMRKFKT